MDTYRLEEVGSDVVGFIYERLIPEEERHRLGQFYTPPQIAELITKWAIREPTDKILDPACGSGTFLVKAYGMLKDFKPLRGHDVHKEILGQIYAIDINPFPGHLTAMNLAMRDVRHPTSEMNIIVEDFFNINPSQKVLAPYTMKTPTGEVRRQILIPKVDVIVANPPYTSWKEISEKVRAAISKSLKQVLDNYRLTGGMFGRGAQAGIYVHFILNATRFLMAKGKLGMIISSEWLHSDYGPRFARFLLDHYKIKTIVDFSPRLFKIPLVGTLVLLLERCEQEIERANNNMVFVHVPSHMEQVEVDEILSAIDRPSIYSGELHVRAIKQADSPRDVRWIEFLFGADKVREDVERSPLVTKMSNLFEPRRSNVSGIFMAKPRPATGADGFFFMTSGQAKIQGIENESLVPAIARPLSAPYFVFTEKDWIQAKEEGRPCYLFICHKPTTLLNGSKALGYIRQGESQGYNRGVTCRLREEDDKFFGWYDLGEVLVSSIFITYRANIIPRFMLMRCSAALEDGFLSLIQKQGLRLSLPRIKALLAYLNSSFGHFYFEVLSRSAGGGAAELYTKFAQTMPILDIRKLGQDDVEDLAYLFDELESECRRLGGLVHMGRGGAERTMRVIRNLKPLVQSMDEQLARILRLDQKVVKHMRYVTTLLRERRLSRIGEAKPETVVGDEAPRIRPPPKRRKETEESLSTPLDRWT